MKNKNEEWKKIRRRRRRNVTKQTNNETENEYIDV